MDIEKLEDNIGKKCRKRPLDDKNKSKYKQKPFKSGKKINTILGVIPHPHINGEMAYTFKDDDSYVECRRCEVIRSKISIKTKEDIDRLRPIKPSGFWWKDFLSNFILISACCGPLLTFSAIGLLLGFYEESKTMFSIIILTTLLLSLILIGNTGSIPPDKFLKIHFYKKRKKIWNRWWNETKRHIQYLEYRQKLENGE